jgi:hypothetical protein
MKIKNVTFATFWTDALDCSFVGIRSLPEFLLYHIELHVIFHLNFSPKLQVFG